MDKEPNSLYFVIFALLVILILITIYNIPDYHKIKAKKELCDNSILLETNKKIYYVNPELCYLYLSHLKNNIIILYQNFDKSLYNEIIPYIKIAKENLREFIGSTKQYDDMTREKSIIRLNVQDNNVTISDSRSCSNFINSEISDIGIVDILLDLEIIMQTLETEDCNDKKLKLSNVHLLMEEMKKYAKSKTNTSEISYSTSDTITKDLYDISGYEYNTFKCNDEILCNESEAIYYTTPTCNITKFNNINCFGSQEYNESEGNIISGNTRNYKYAAPFNNIEKIRKEIEKKKSITTDLNAKRSLLTDYDYLDNV